MKKKIVIILILITSIQILTRIYFGFQKEYFHMDEMYSYGLMNYDKLNIADNSDFLNIWHNKEYYKDYLEVNEDELYDFRPVYENQKNDVHPPLYYLLLRIASSFNVNNFSKWTGLILNIFIFAISNIFIYLIAKIIFKNPIYALLTCLINGFTLIALNSSLYIRMYELCNLNILIITYLHLKIYNKEKLKIPYEILITVCLILGGLTHYYYFIYVLILAIIYIAKCIKTKRYRNLGLYLAGTIIAAGVYLLIFPYAISHILFGYRGVGTNVNILNNLWGYIWIINKEFFNYLLPLILAIMIFACLRKKKRKININKKIYLLLIPSLIYLIVVILKSPYVEARYIMPIYSIINISSIYLIKTYLKKSWDNKSTLFITTLLFLLIIYSPMVTRTKLEYTYTKYNNIAKKIEDKNLPITYVLNTNKNRFLDDLYLFTLVDSSIILDYNNLQESVLKNQQEDFILICNEGVDEEKIKEILENKEITYMQKMNACNIYEVK